MKSWLEKNDIEMCSTHNEGKYIFAERFIRTLKIKLISIWFRYQKMCTLINQIQLINIIHTIAQLKLNLLMQISKYQNIFAKGYVPNWSEQVLVIKKPHVNSDLKGK